MANILFNIQGQSGLRPAAVISNHVSYIDILYHISAVFPSFAPKVCMMYILQCSVSGLAKRVT